jgi:hypothetical protein
MRESIWDVFAPVFFTVLLVFSYVSQNSVLQYSFSKLASISAIALVFVS